MFGVANHITLVSNTPIEKTTLVIRDCFVLHEDDSSDHSYVNFWSQSSDIEADLKWLAKRNHKYGSYYVHPCCDKRGLY